MKQNIIKNGIMAGVVAIGYVLLFYYINKEWLFTGTFVFSSLLFYLFFMLGTECRARDGAHPRPRPRGTSARACAAGQGTRGVAR